MQQSQWPIQIVCFLTFLAIVAISLSLSLSLSHTHTHTHTLCVSLRVSLHKNVMNLKISSSSRTESFDNLTKVWPWSFAFVQLLKNNEKYIPPPIWLLCEKEPPSVMGNLGPICIQVVWQTIYNWWSLSHSFELGWLWKTGTCAFSTCTNKRLIKWGVYWTTYGIVLFILFSLIDPSKG
jgi:hypothetical protein